MKVAFDQQMFLLQKYGGISRYIVKLAEHLNYLDHDAKIFAPLHINQHARELPRKLVFGKYFSRSLYKKGFNYLSQTLAAQAINFWQPNILHETYYCQQPSGRKTCPIIVTAHDMIHEIFSDEFGSVEDIKTAKLAAFNRADHIICNSKSTQNDLLKYTDIKIEKTTVVHLGQDLLKVRSQSEVASPHPRPFILYVGSRNSYKNFAGLLEAYAKSNLLMKNLDLIAFGAGNFNQETFNEMGRLAISKNKVLHMKGDDKLLEQLYRHAAVFVYPSHYEGFGLPPLEAMAHSCPVASSNTSSMPEVIGDAAGFFDPKSPDDIQRAIEKIVFDDNLKKALIKRGHERVKEFSWQKCAEQTALVYNSVL